MTQPCNQLAHPPGLLCCPLVSGPQTEKKNTLDFEKISIAIVCTDCWNMQFSLGSLLYETLF